MPVPDPHEPLPGWPVRPGSSCSPTVYKCPYCRTKCGDVVAYAVHLHRKHPRPYVLGPPHVRRSRNLIRQLLRRTLEKVRPRN